MLSASNYIGVPWCAHSQKLAAPLSRCHASPSAVAPAKPKEQINSLPGIQLERYHDLQYSLLVCFHKQSEETHLPCVLHQRLKSNQSEAEEGSVCCPEWVFEFHILHHAVETSCFASKKGSKIHLPMLAKDTQQ